MKKLFVVTDVHGHFNILKDALDNAGFDKNNESHLLVCCGDYFDRGNENVDVLKFFERLDNKVLLRGNHEDLLLKLLQTGKVLPHNYINGTIQTLSDFFGKYFIDPITDTIDFDGHNSTVDRICEFIDSTVNYFETEKYIFVHGWIPETCKTVEERKNISDNLWEKARWIKWTDMYNKEQRVFEDKTIVCGHVPTFFAYRVDDQRDDKNSDIYYGNGMIALDAGTFDSGRINVLVLEDNLI